MWNTPASPVHFAPYGLNLTNAQLATLQAQLAAVIAAEAADAAAIAALPVFASNVYTPIITLTLNVSAAPVSQCQFCRVGSVAIVSGYVSVDAIAPGPAEIGISLPIASNFGSAAADEACGAATASAIAGQNGAFFSDPTNDRVRMLWDAVSLVSNTMSFIFAYRII